ncbi:MAG: sulfatase-like hydrolase/transferase, partial [Anaerolineae bacterium]|nr:sulfatase-like hydrolase/transferase [Anaerolineae bacterium]
DIYYIIVDAYARADILEEVYHFDNSEFLSYLAEKGFYVADKSVTNYPQTSLSLASSLNFMYLDGLAGQMGTETDNRQPLHVMIKNNKVFQYLRNHGYTFLAFSSGYGATEITNADIYMEPPKQWDISEFQEALITLTPLSVFRKTFFDARRDRVTYAFDHIADATQVDGPTFAFVHVQVPHWPFIFDADGRPVEPHNGIGMRGDYEYDEFIEGYKNQLIFVNRRLQNAIDEILPRASDLPIIIIQSDHGPDAKLDYGGWRIEKTYLPERMSIFNAYYFPDQNYEALYESITPVNTFRVIFNNYFGADYELLGDRSYFASWSHPYLFTDVTDEMLSGERQ